ncbi:MAG TPA: polysaccharide biosynthesis/export family protein [Chitinophagaceae bacterium]|nr:polysaccharide biosynthesis/export family protein [Chitinophagaceae bacterium]
MTKSTGLVALLCFLTISILCSCGNVRHLQYLQGQFDTARLSQVKYPEPVIQKNELISIVVYSDDPRASAFYNLPLQSTINNTVGTGSSSTSTGNQTSGSQFLVDEYGKIQFPGLGEIEVAGLTKDSLYKLLQARLQDKLSHPYFIIRLSSYKITMIGEVSKPGQFTIPNERVSLLEAIALAGDLTLYGRRDNVLIIREINGQRNFARLDLKNPEILNSPYYYLQPNDVVLVDVNRTKAAQSDQVTVRNITLATSVISVLAVIFSLLRN